MIRGTCGSILRKHKAAGTRSCSEIPRAACPRRAAGDVIGGVAGTSRVVLAADVQVVQVRAGVVAGGAVVGDSFVEDLEDVVGSSVGFGLGFFGWVEG